MHDIIAVKVDQNMNVIETLTDYDQLSQIVAQSPFVGIRETFKANNIYFISKNWFSILKDKFEKIKCDNSIVDYDQYNKKYVFDSENNTGVLEIDMTSFSNLKNDFKNMISNQEKYLKDMSKVISFSDLENQVQNLITYFNNLSTKKNQILNSIDSSSDIPSLLEIDMKLSSYQLT